MPHKEVTFLLVEDDDVEIMIFQRTFKELKIANEIVIAHDGIEALEHLRGENNREQISKPFIILLDINMPRMNGIEFLKEIRNDEDLSQSVVFVLTTSKDQSDKMKAYDNHVAGYIVKGSSGELFIDALKMLDRYWRVVELPS